MQSDSEESGAPRENKCDKLLRYRVYPLHTGLCSN
jgi:hypothetical protein